MTELTPMVNNTEHSTFLCIVVNKHNQIFCAPKPGCILEYSDRNTGKTQQLSPIAVAIGKLM